MSHDPTAYVPSSNIGGGYAGSSPRPHATVRAVLSAVVAGSSDARLVVIAGPPGIGKTSLAHSLQRLKPESMLIDKDWCAAPFIIEFAQQTGTLREQAYGTDLYWERLRPLEYAGAVTLACQNLVGDRTVLLVGGWGPELGVDNLWTSWEKKISPASLLVVHLDPPDLEEWRARMEARGSRTDRPWFDSFCDAVGNLPVWAGAVRIDSSALPQDVVTQTVTALDSR